MKKDKFLTVYAVLDDNTQVRLNNIQKSILALGKSGTQTMDIPFHVTLGSFQPDMAEVLIKRIKNVAVNNTSFSLDYEGVSHFGNRVLFCSPNINNQLSLLHSFFDEDYAGGFVWHPHTTLFCGDEDDVRAARAIAEELFVPFSAEVVAIELGEFFPTKIIHREYLKNV